MKSAWVAMVAVAMVAACDDPAVEDTGPHQESALLGTWVRDLGWDTTDCRFLEPGEPPVSIAVPLPLYITLRAGDALTELDNAALTAVASEWTEDASGWSTSGGAVVHDSVGRDWTVIGATMKLRAPWSGSFLRQVDGTWSAEREGVICTMTFVAYQQHVAPEL